MHWPVGKLHPDESSMAGCILSLITASLEGRHGGSFQHEAWAAAIVQ